MAGRPITRQHVAILDEQGEETIQELVAEGASIRDLAKMFGIGFNGYYAWLDAEPGRRERIARCREIRAEALDAEGLAIVDGAELDRDAIAKAKLQVEQRRWMSKQLDPSRRGGANVQVNVGIGELHLQAVKQVGGGGELEAGEENIPEADYVVEGGDEDS